MVLVAPVSILTHHFFHLQGIFVVVCVYADTSVVGILEGNSLILIFPASFHLISSALHPESFEMSLQSSESPPSVLAAFAESTPGGEASHGLL